MSFRYHDSKAAIALAIPFPLSSSPYGAKVSDRPYSAFGSYFRLGCVTEKIFTVATVFVSQLKLTIFRERRQSEARPFGRVSLLVFSGMSVPSWDGNGMPPSFFYGNECGFQTKLAEKPSRIKTESQTVFIARGLA